MTTSVSNPTKTCECGHAKQRHSGGRGLCSVIIAGYHSPRCLCSSFRFSKIRFTPWRTFCITLLMVDGDCRIAKNALVQQIRKALTYFPKNEQ